MSRSGPIRLEVYGAEKTLVDCFRHRRRLGMVAAGQCPAAAAGDGGLFWSPVPVKTCLAASIWWRLLASRSTTQCCWRTSAHPGRGLLTSPRMWL